MRKRLAGVVVGLVKGHRQWPSIIVQRLRVFKFIVGGDGVETAPCKVIGDVEREHVRLELEHAVEVGSDDVVVGVVTVIGQ